MKSKRKRLKKAAGRLPASLRDVATTKWTCEAERRQRWNRGTFGAASDVRKIDPDLYETREA